MTFLLKVGGITLQRSSGALLRQWQSRPCVCWCSSFSIPSTPIFKQAKNFQDRIAVVDQNGQHTYGRILKLSDHLAYLIQNLSEKGVSQQRVAFLCPNDVSYIITQWATWIAGHIAVPLFPKHPTSQLEYFVRDSESSIIVTTSTLAGKIKPILSGQHVIVLEEYFFKDSSSNTDILENMESSNADGTGGNCSEDFCAASDAMIIYTSGTTGPPKGVVLTHKNLQSQMSCMHRAWGWTSGDTILHCLPLHHVHGIVNALMCPLYVGARVVMLPEFSAAAAWNGLLSLHSPAESRVNIFMAVPTIYAKMIEEYETKIVKNDRMRDYVKAVCMQNIRLMVSGSSALPEPILDRWQQITGHTLLERYGMTEIGMALSNPLKGSRKPGYVGNALPDVELRIAKFSQGKQEYDVLAYGNHKGTHTFTETEEEIVGELLVRGPNVFKEYWKKPQATAKEFTHDGWFRTGDTAQYINDSYKILGRTSVDIIKSGGFKISALDVERHLLSHPNIEDVAVVGIPDITWGQKIAAVIQWSGEGKLDPLELRAWGKDCMPHYYIPSVVISVSEQIPRNNMGKVNKKQILRDFFPDSS